eukprot:1181654-Pyramimonas_sp.AAC.1
MSRNPTGMHGIAGTLGSCSRGASAPWTAELAGPPVVAGSAVDGGLDADGPAASDVAGLLHTGPSFSPSLCAAAGRFIGAAFASFFAPPLPYPSRIFSASSAGLSIPSW